MRNYGLIMDSKQRRWGSVLKVVNNLQPNLTGFFLCCVCAKRGKSRTSSKEKAANFWLQFAWMWLTACEGQTSVSAMLTELSTCAFGKRILTSLFLRNFFFIRRLAFLGAVAGSVLQVACQWGLNERIKRWKIQGMIGSTYTPSPLFTLPAKVFDCQP